MSSLSGRRSGVIMSLARFISEADKGLETGPGEVGRDPRPGNPLRPGIPLLKQIAPLSSEHVHYY